MVGALALFSVIPAFAQTAVDNIARIANPAGLACTDVATNPTCERSDNVVITVSAPQPNFGSCDATMYLGQNSPTGLFEFDTSNNPFDVDPVGPISPITYNAIAYNPVDNYIYGLRGPAPGTLVRIGSDGSVVDLGAIANLPNASIMGEIAPDGAYYVGIGFTLYRIDIPTRTATAIALNRSLNGADLAWHNGRLYTAVTGGGDLLEIDPVSGNVIALGATGVAGGFGGMFGASNGVFGSNNSGGFYQFDLATGQATLISGLPGSGNNDGAKCATTPLEFPADLSITKDDGSDEYMPGEDVVYTIVVSNLGPFGVSGATVSDPLPTGITDASWTCVTGANGGSCGIASGSGAIGGVPVSLPANATVVFTLTMSVPDDFSGDLVNTATVTEPAAGSPDPTPGNNAATDTDIASTVVTVDKRVAPASGTPVSVGDTLAYTLAVTVANGPTTVDEVLVDTLGAGLTVGTLPTGCTAAGQDVTCTLPAGAAIGEHLFEYTATVDADATTSVSNSVVPSSGTCVTCTTTNPVEPTVTVNKTVDPGNGTAVSVGDTLAYTLSVNVANAVTTAPEVLVDTLGAGLTVGTLPTGCTAAGQVVTCTLPAGATIGEHLFEYTATVDADAVTSVSNSVAPNSGTCLTCTTSNPLTPEITVSKTVDPADGTAVSVGDTLTYTLSVNVANAVTTDAEVLVDTLGTGLTIGIVPAGCTASGQVLTCTLAAGAAVGEHLFEYTATVGADATTSVSNSVVPSSGACLTCTTTNPIDPTITVTKSVNPISGTAVSVGDTLTYALSVNVANAATTDAEVLVDTLGSGLTVGTLPAGCTASGQVVTCTLPVGAEIGEHLFEYTATVDADATTSVSNSVVPNTGTCLACTTNNPVEPTVTVSKTVDPADGTAVSVGDTLTYTLSVNVANALTTDPEVLVDTLGAGLTIGTLPAGCVASGQVITCTLAAGAAIGEHLFEYTATVGADATTTVSNSVVPGSGTCLACTTTNPVDPTITVSKTVDPGNGTAVSVGDTLAYTLAVTVANAVTVDAEVLVDTLGAGLTVGTLPAGCMAAGQVITCTLAAGSAIGEHLFEYTATVGADATTTVSNSVVPSSGSCVTCTTSNPLTPEITVNKTVDPASGTAVSVGDTLAYTLTVTVANAATTTPEVLVDTLGTGLAIDTLPAGCSASGQVVTCTLASGSAIGSYPFEYTATVGADATTSVSNSVVPSSGTCVGCTTTNPVEPTVTVNKTVDPGNGTAVSVGDTLAYTLSVSVANAVTTDPEVLVDTLGAGLTIGTLPAGCTASGQVITCTLAAGAAIGEHLFEYTATVGADATTTVSNSVVPSSGNCLTCTTSNPLTPEITVSKTVDPASGTAVSVGDTLTYTLSVNVANAATTDAEVLVDTLGTGLVVGTLPAGCVANGQVITCTLASGSVIGTYLFEYTATVGANATTSVNNSVVPSSGTCVGCTTTNPVEPTVTVNKTVDPGNGTAVSVGDTVAYTLSVNVANAVTTDAEVLVDTLGAGLTAGTLPAGCSAAGQVITCTLAAGAAIGEHLFEYTATVDADAVTSVSNSVVPSSGTCVTCTTTNPVDPTITVNKAVDPANGTAVSVGDTLTYTLSVNVANAVTIDAEVLVDTLGAGLNVGTLPAGCTASGQVITCTLAAGAAIGEHLFEYTATVDADATTSVSNSVVPSSGTCLTCTTSNPLTPEITVSKTVDPASGTAVSVGDTLTYTLSVNVANAVTTDPEVLVDTLGTGLIVDTLPAGCTAAGQVLTCTLAAGAAIGEHLFEYTATVGADATTSVSNSVVPSSGTCAGCTTSNPVVPRVSVSKSSDPASGERVKANDEVTYTVSVTVANSATTEAIILTDTFSGAQALLADSIIAPAGGSCAPSATGLICTLAAGAAPGVHEFAYRTRVAANASGSIGNRVVPDGGGGSPPDCTSCATEHEIAEPVVNVTKSADPGSDAELHVGDTIAYTLTVTVADAATTSELVLDDTPGPGLTIGALPAGCAATGTGLRCLLPSGSIPGTYAFTYPATVNPDAGETVRNAVLASGGGGEQNPPNCLACETSHRVLDTAQLRIVKAASVRETRIGELVRYTLTVENVGATNVRDAEIVDTPAAGFSYVDDSLAVVDGDNAATVAGYNPIRFGGLDIDAGQSATLVYLMRVGAGVRPGVLVNQAQAYPGGGGDPISNIATAEVTLASDPMVDESLILGTVFDDRDGDGWQDSAAMTGVHVQGGFDPAAYLPGSTTVDRGDGAKPEPDASAPLLHGIEIGTIGARQSIADPVARRQVVIRQRLREASFTDDFVLTTDQGATLRMDAAGNTTVERTGEAEKGLNGADPTVTRRVAQGEGGVVVDYVIGNAGVDERGIPGVRIASVDGLLMETDQFGRYHLAGVPGGAWERGRNFILKADPSTLPPGTEITTDNPLLRRITPGLPVRFDFGARMPVEQIVGGERQVELELGEVVFEPGSAEVRAQYAPVLEQVAARVAEYQGGEVVIHAGGDSEGLAFGRASAVKEALLAKLPADVARALVVSVRTRVDDPSTLVAGTTEGGALLGTVLFDTDRATIRPQYDELLGKVAAWLEQRGGGSVAIVGHADPRGSDDYNAALGMRRARAVFDAIAARLSPEVRGNVRVESSSDPAAPAGNSGK